MAATTMSRAASGLASRVPSFTSRGPTPRASTPPALSPRPGAATPLSHAATASDAGRVIAAAASELLRARSFPSPRGAVVARASSTLEAPTELLAALRAADLDAPPPPLSSPLPPLPPLPPAAHHRQPPQHPHHLPGERSHLAAGTHTASEQQHEEQQHRHDQQQPGPEQDRCEHHAAAPPQARPVDDSHATGRFADDYEMGELLGRGTFGEVRVAAERATGRQAAVKIVPKRQHGRDRREAIYREVGFCRELQSCAAVVRLFAVYEDEASIYIVQELCSGGDASGLLAAAGGRLDEREAAAVMLGALRFLARAHDAGVCYGDVKPSNFVLRQLYPSIAHMLDPAVPKGPIDLCAVDFGCCQHTEPGACLPSVPVSGTPAYLAPECFQECFGMPSDVWAAGVMMYHLLTGAFPFWAGGADEFHGMSAYELRDGIVRGSPMFMQDPWAACAPSARDLVLRMLDKDPARRITAAGAASHRWFADALVAAAGGGAEAGAAR